MSGSSGLRPVRIRQIARAVFGAVLGLALLLPLAERHSTLREHSALDPAVLVFTDAVHPTLPAHLESSATEIRERCAYCLLQLQSLSRLHSSPPVLAVLSSPHSAPRAPTFFPAARPITPSSPRAPPAASAA